MPLTLSRNKSGWKVPRKEGSEVRGGLWATKCRACAYASAERQEGRPCRPLLTPPSGAPLTILAAEERRERGGLPGSWLTSGSGLPISSGSESPPAT